MAVVQKGDLISLNLEDGKEIQVEWQQKLSKKKKAFKAIPFTVKETQAKDLLFLESALEKEFLAMCKEEESDSSSTYELRVTDALQYGQDSAKDTKIRFLVYHEKSDNIYQHRFMQSTKLGSFLEKAEQFSALVPKYGAMFKKFSDLSKAFIGDKLKNF